MAAIAPLYLSASSDLGPTLDPAKNQLLGLRQGLIEGCTPALVSGLLDDLLHSQMFSDAEVEEIKETQKPTRDKIRDLVDWARKKGDDCSRFLLQKVTERDPELSNKLGIAEIRAKYMARMKAEYELYQEWDYRIGEEVSLKKQYTRLVIIEGHREEKEREHEITSSGRRHLEIMAERSSNNITIPRLFDPTERGIVPKIVVLQGAAGIGKTMTSRKIMLEWASEGLYQDTFHFAFYMSCRELNTITDDISLADLLSRICHLQCERSHLTSIFREDDKVLFLIDGFDELKSSLNHSEQCRDPFQKTSVGILLKSLLGKLLLWRSSLIITTRPLSLKSLGEVVKRTRYVAILGFTEDDRVEYFQRSFTSEEEAAVAIQTVKSNDILFTMCAAPIVCWLVCTTLKQQMTEGLDVSSCNTTTSIYLLYLEGLLLYHCRNPDQALNCIKKLCALANEGVWLRKIFFDEGDLRRHGLSISEITSVFLAENLFHRDARTESCSSFLHLSLQEVFASLYYVLVPESERRVAAAEQSPSSEVRTLTQLLETYAYHLDLTRQFFCGLMAEGQIQKLEKCLHCNISFRGKAAVEKWLETGWGLSNNKVMCLYEAQDVEMVRRIMSQKENIEMYESTSVMEVRAFSYCLMNSEREHCFDMNRCVIGAESQRILSPALHKCSRIMFYCCTFGDNEESSPDISRLCESLTSLPVLRKLELWKCGLTSSCCADLCSVITTNTSLTSLDLRENPLQDSGIKLLCEGLRHPGCVLQELGLRGCDLTSSCCADLCSVITTNTSLTSLDLSQNPLQDAGIKLLCEGLRHPGCVLQELRLEGCGLTSSCCADLCSVITTNTSLTSLDLSRNPLQDSGIKLLCEGLRHPGCVLQYLRLEGCGLTSSCCADLCSVITTNTSLTSLALSGNPLQDSGIKLLCEGLRHPGCVLQELGLEECDLTSSCCADLCSVITTNTSLTSLDLGGNPELDGTILHESVGERHSAMPELR
ncbi:NACHT, LRR and PYD domains-containing protein 3-like [Gastrophryne carolinensis]